MRELHLGGGLVGLSCLPGFRYDERNDLFRMPLATDTHPFPAGDRFELIAERGAGGMGIVYEVIDRQRQVRVALKAVRHAGARQLLRLKSEFRALRDLAHPNLVRLGELFEHDGRWFFTMELVDGVDFRAWTRPGALAAAAPGALAHPATVRDAPPAAAAAGTMDTRAMPLRPVPSQRLSAADVLYRASRAPLPAAFDEARVRAGLRGLSEGVLALHRAGMVHRDIKPSNVLVEASGRVVLLDFGVVAELRERAVAGGEREVVGTWAYMPSEQAAGLDPNPAADWYAVGVMLFEALTGELPFSADQAGLHLKASIAAPAPSALTVGVPPDLDALCVRLLARDPAQRPHGEEVLASLGAAVRAPAPRVDPVLPYVGRGAERSRLRNAYARSCAGESVIVLVTGESGMGKSALVARFLEELDEAEDGSPLVLGSGCDAREIVPYNAFDGLVDRLARALSRMPAEEVTRLAPATVDALLRVFPVLAGVEALADAALVGRHSQDQRGDAFVALAELLRRLAAQRPIVLTIDDVHWADADSRALFTEVWNGPHAPPILLVATARGLPDEPLPAALADVRTPIETVALGPLPAADAERLAREAFAAMGGELDAAVIAREAHGHPMFVTELARFSIGAGAGAGTLALDEVLRRRIGALAQGGRRLLALVALAAAPLPEAAAAAAAGLSPTDLARELRDLRGERLLRVVSSHGAQVIEPYHDKVREAASAGLAEAERARLHGRLERALDQAGAPPEVLAYHLIGAGEHERAAAMALLAARRAAKALAFERAAEWLRSALSLGSAPSTTRRALHAELGDLLTRAGRPEEAAAAFLTAAATGDPDDDERRELRRRAAEEYLWGGYLDQGLAAIRELLDEVDLHMPETTAGAVAGLLFYQARLALLPLSWKPRREEDVRRSTLARLDVCWTAASGLSLVDSTRGASFASRLPLMCLAVGEPKRIAKAFAAATMAQASMGQRRQATRYLAAARKAAAEVNDPVVDGHLGLAEMAVHFYQDNDWRAALERSDRGAREWLDAGRGRSWELDVFLQHSLWSLNVVGELGELGRRVPGEVRAARRSGNRFLETSLRTFFPVVHLVSDDVAGARADLDDALTTWTEGNDVIGNQFFFAQKGRSQVALYAGDVDEHIAQLDADWQRCWRSLLTQVPIIRAEVCSWRGQLAIERAATAYRRGQPRAVKERLAEARMWQRRLRRTGLPLASNGVLSAEYGIALCEGRRADAVAVLRQLLVHPIFRQMAAALAAARWRLGGLLGGDEGEALREQARGWYAAQGVQRPDKMAATFLPTVD